MDAALIKELERIVGEKNVLTSLEDRICYSYDATLYRGLPDVVVKPDSTEEVSKIMRLANKHGVPVTPRGAGTGLSGGSVPAKGGIVMSMTRMTRIKEIDPENLLAVCEPGTINLDLDNAVEEYGIFYPPDPASKKVCTMGGNIAECAGGLRGLKYGVTRDYVLGLEAVLPTGDVIRTGCRTVKGVTGYDLTKLIIGSEGTLAIVTEITVKLLPIPEHKETMMAVFKDLAQAGQAVSNIIAAGIIPATLEFLDNATIQCVEDYKHIGLPREAAAILLIETDGIKEAAQKEAKEVIRICKETGAISVEIAQNEEQRDKLWEARRSALAAITRLDPSLLQEDVVVPRSKLADMAVAADEIYRKYNLKGATYGHAGDGNLHPSILTDVRRKDEMERAELAIKEIFEAAVRLGGTLSGEHGIGTEKAPYFKLEVSDETANAMLALKKAWDPNDILNPGKIFYGNGGE
jgi:glycolate oxidase